MLVEGVGITGPLYLQAPLFETGVGKEAYWFEDPLFQFAPCVLVIGWWWVYLD